MVGPNIVAKNFTLSNNIIEFFGKRGTKVGETYLVNELTPDLEDRLDIEVDISYIDSALSDIQKTISFNTKTRGIRKITTLTISPNTAVLFFLKGILTTQILRQARESATTIVFPNVQILKSSFTVIVDSTSEYAISF